MITEDYVSFQVAKLLKEKGFDCSRSDISAMYNEDGKLFSLSTADKYYYDYDDFDEKDYIAPTLQMAMKWLRKIHSLEIYPYHDYGEDNDSWWFEIIRSRSSYAEYESDSIYLKYEEACEAAIKYCLENLIKNEDEEEKSDIPVPKTVDEAIHTLEKILSDEDREYLLENGAISMHDSLGRWIRNEWGLWTGSELKDELLNMNKGLNHPDDMSNYIIEEFIKYWNNKL